MTKEQLLALKEPGPCDPWDSGWNAAIDHVIELLGTSEPTRDVCPQCGGNAPWIPVRGEKLIEIETREPCHVEWTSGNSAYVKWDTPACNYGTFTFKQMREGFERVPENR